MTVFDGIKSKNIDELTEWINENLVFDRAPFWKWWDNNYCSKCVSELGYMPHLNKECEFAWCELNGKCKFFMELNDIPDEKQIVKMWLESEA